MRVLISPDKFAGTLTAAQAAAAIAGGWSAVRPDDDLELVPLADGGEGTIDVLRTALPDVAVHTVEVADARGLATEAVWLGLPDGTAVVEVAQACGLSQLASDDRDPLKATSYGVGMLLADALRSGPSAVLVGLGGSATVDGGVGMIASLGAHGLRRRDGNGVKVGGRWVADVASVAPLDLRALTGGAPTRVVVASDVTNPLLGPSGAAAVFGPQKGATADGVAELEAALSVWADVVEDQLPGGPWRDRPGAGAAGGLGFALMAFLGAEVRSGAAVIGELVGFDPAGADVVITGEGKLDAQTLAGKGPDEVRAAAAAAGATTICLAGVIADGAGDRFDIAESLGPDGLTRPSETLRAAATRAAERIDARSR